MVRKEEVEEFGAKRQRTLDTTGRGAHTVTGCKTEGSCFSDLQKSFNRYVAEMVALDGLPLSVTKGLGFRSLLEFLKPELNLPFPEDHVKAS
ncbi:hypothetical protein HPB48_012091 [Haemaphysalis longicornis]|uniref:Uncharacterized protein n=1 Tax=Haemaphysalis longicornis TaxID=44386 RepID=A0A9J6FC85_HAELO|nr:hypothetical protein HPB48_012091 [Haemaphysalis longicornis]